MSEEFLICAMFFFMFLFFGGRWRFIAQTYLLVMPPPGGRPGISSAARNFITYKRSGSSSLDLIIWIISAKGESKQFEMKDRTVVKSAGGFVFWVWSKSVNHLPLSYQSVAPALLPAAVPAVKPGGRRGR